MRPMISILVLWVLGARPVVACPDCPAARETRTLVWTQEFGFNLLALILPFVGMAAVLVAIERLGRSRA